MAERMAGRYRQLFEVRILHHYWLDRGASVFDRITDQAMKARLLQAYDVRRLLGIRPTGSTRVALAANQCLFEETALGFVVLLKGSASLPADSAFEFMIVVRDSRFFDYSALTLRPQRIHEAYDRSEGVTCRYKENVPVVSNLSGATRGAGAGKLLFLSRRYRPLAPNEQVEALGLSGTALGQLTSDGPDARVQQLAADANDLPVYLHQGDVPAIIPPAGVVGVPARGVRLSDDVADDVFALISLSAVRPGDSAFSFVDAAGRAKSSPPLYQLRIRNRSTFWIYVNKTTGVVDSVESDALPLTHFGNAGQKQKPSERLVKVEKTGAVISRLVSEVHV